jgi:SAM-dependent methyltransferase
VETRTGTAEATGLPDGYADALVVGAAFHWFTRPAADAEIARVLRPGGSVALLWNPVDPGDPLYEPFAGLRLRLGMGRLEFDPGVELDRRWFGPTERRDFRHTAQVPVDSYAEQFASRSYVIALPPRERDEAVGAARAAAAARARDGRLAISYITTVLRAFRAR